MVRNFGFLFLLFILFVAHACLSFAKEQLVEKSPFQWHFPATPAAFLAVRTHESRFFRSYRDGERLLPKSMIRYQSLFQQTLATPCQLLSETGSESITVYDGTVITLEDASLRLLSGRIKVNLPGKESEIMIRVPQAVFILQNGEALAEKFPDGNFLFALKKGSAWIKDSRRQIYKISPGKQIGFSRLGKPGKITDIDDHWKAPIFCRAPTRNSSAIASDSDSDSDEDADDNENAGENGDDGEVSPKTTSEGFSDINETSSNTEIPEPASSTSPVSENLKMQSQPASIADQIK